MNGCPTLRVARATADLDALLPFYRDGLRLDLLYRFADHDGVDGMMLGRPGAPYHLEFTRSSRHAVMSAPSDNDLLVFYLPDRAEWDDACSAMAAAGFEPVTPGNPYWTQRGRTFEDPDGRRVVLQNAESQW